VILRQRSIGHSRDGKIHNHSSASNDKKIEIGGRFVRVRGRNDDTIVAIALHVIYSYKNTISQKCNCELWSFEPRLKVDVLECLPSVENRNTQSEQSRLGLLSDADIAYR
jgi:hypothetical protein